MTELKDLYRFAAQVVAHDGKVISTSPQETTYRARRVAADWINKGEKPENVRIVTRNGADAEWKLDAEETAKIAGLATKRAEKKSEPTTAPVKTLTLDVALRNLEKTCKLLKSVNALTPRDTEALKKSMGDVARLIAAIEEAAAREAAAEGAAREKTSTEATKKANNPMEAEAKAEAEAPTQ